MYPNYQQILILVCNPSNSNTSLLVLDEEDTVCWEGKYKHYAVICLMLIGYYIPLSTMIAQEEEWMYTHLYCLLLFILFSIHAKSTSIGSRKSLCNLQYKLSYIFYHFAVDLE